jgi:hypothetical protein
MYAGPPRKSMPALRPIATVILSALLPTSGFSQLHFPARPQRQQDQSALIAHLQGVYEMNVARGNKRLAALYSCDIANRYKTAGEYENAATWYQKCAVNGDPKATSEIINLVLQNRITLSNPEGLHPRIEERAFCGSQMARTYLLNQWHETTAQLPKYDHKTFTDCVPAGPEDHMDQSMLIALRRRETAEANAAYYREHPDQSPEAQEQKAIEGAAILVGGLMIQAAIMPASGPGSIACNKYQNHYPGAIDPSVCNTPPSK